MVCGNYDKASQDHNSFFGVPAASLSGCGRTIDVVGYDALGLWPTTYAGGRPSGGASS